MTMENKLQQLAAPFPPDVISWRVGSTTKDKTKGMALAYIDARDVQDRLDEVFGFGWQVRNPWSVNGKLACEIGLLFGDQWIWRGDGAGDTDVEAEKGAFSDAFKRAAVRWGIGRYLYDLDSPWVALEQKGNSYIIAPSELPKLRAVLVKKSVAEGAARVRELVASPAPPPDLKALAEKIIRGINAAPYVDALDSTMDITMVERQMLPAVTQRHIDKVYTLKREQLENAK
jgi:hypothetical protein